MFSPLGRLKRGLETTWALPRLSRSDSGPAPLRVRAVICRSLLATVVTLLFTAAQAHADVIVAPPFDMTGILAPDEPYHLMFVTSGVRHANASTIADFNTFVTAQAKLPGAVTESYDFDWKAIASTGGGQHARDNAPIDGDVPVFLLNGDKVADGFDDLWDGELHVAPNWDQFLQGQNAYAWTGTNQDGSAHSDQYLGQDEYGHIGQPGRKDLWISYYYGNPQSAARPFYALSPQLRTTAVPEPSSLVAVTGLLGMGFMGRLWRRRKLSKKLPLIS